ncbi:MAG TPA: hypothetical protein PKC47_14150, partial [Petrimonas sp.]|nr:hypothetical protein [Petrimonas sp.]
SLNELAIMMPTLNEIQQKTFIGGGDGSQYSPYTIAEFDAMCASGNWNGGYVEGWGYTFPDVIISGSYNGVSGNNYSSGTNPGYSGNEGSFNDPTQTHYYWWGKSEIIELNQQQSYDYYHNFENTGRIQSAIAGVITSFASWPVGVAVTIGGYTFSYAQSKAVYEAAKSGGIRIESITTYGNVDPSIPNSGTTTRIKDINGNTLLIY